MRFRLMALAALAALSACGSSPDARNFSVYFQPYSADLDDQAQETAEAAGRYAKDHATLPVSVVGFSNPADPGRDFDGQSAQRAEAIMRVLTAQGVSANRISTSSSSVIDPLPVSPVAARRVDIAVGSP